MLLQNNSKLYININTQREYNGKIQREYRIPSGYSKRENENGKRGPRRTGNAPREREILLNFLFWKSIYARVRLANHSQEKYFQSKTRPCFTFVCTHFFMPLDQKVFKCFKFFFHIFCSLSIVAVIWCLYSPALAGTESD